MEPLIFRTHSLLRREKFEIEDGHQPQNALFIVTDGSFSCCYDGEEPFTASVGDLVFFPIKCHFIRNILSPCTFQLIYFNINEKSPLAEALPHGLVNTSGKEHLKNDLDILSRFLYDTHEIALCLKEHALNDIFFNVVYDTIPGMNGSSLLSPQIQTILDYFDEHYREDLTLENAAKLVSLSPNGLVKKFRQETGFTPIDYLIHLRLQHAKILLQETDRSISLIAEECGYVNLFYFSRSFKKETGCSPTQYRKNKPIA